MPNRHLHAPVRPLPVSAIERVGALIAERTPRADAAARVTIGAPHARSAYLAYTRLAGPRDDVLDYAAYLLASDLPHGARWELDAVERDVEGELTLLLSRSLYEAP